VFAALLLVTAPAVITSRLIVEYQPIFFGLAAMLLAQAPNGLVGLLRLPDLRRMVQSGQWLYRSGPVWDRARLVGAVEEVAGWSWPSAGSPPATAGSTCGATLASSFPVARRG